MEGGCGGRIHAECSPRQISLEDIATKSVIVELVVCGTLPIVHHCSIPCLCTVNEDLDMAEQKGFGGGGGGGGAWGGGGEGGVENTIGGGGGGGGGGGP